MSSIFLLCIMQVSEITPKQASIIAQMKSLPPKEARKL
jgi:hypothetical protein